MKRKRYLDHILKIQIYFIITLQKPIHLGFKKADDVALQLPETVKTGKFLIFGALNQPLCRTVADFNLASYINPTPEDVRDRRLALTLTCPAATIRVKPRQKPFFPFSKRLTTYACHATNSCPDYGPGEVERAWDEEKKLA